ncbi:MAG: thiamine-binding protein [Acidimicrobiales bacterium]
MAVVAAFSISPVGGPAATADGSVGLAVAEVVRIVRQSGLPNETNAMFTNVEGTLDEVFALIKQCIDHMASIAPRVSVVVKLDIRPGHVDAMHAKVASLERSVADETP